MIVFADMHHDDLWRSLQLLFEKRLQWKLYRPWGTEWFEKGFWKIAEPYNNSPDTIAQYLGWEHQPKDKTPILNTEGRRTELMTFEEFCEHPPDIILATIPAHYSAYKLLRDQYAPNAKVICHSGNNWRNIDWSIVDNFLGSVASFQCPVPHIFYHQEFDTNIFYPGPISDRKLIVSFLNAPQNFSTHKLWLDLQGAMPDWEFQEFGASSRDGCLDHLGIAQWMREARFIWQVKPGGDGYGHILHNAFAVGTPVITRRSDYKDTLGDSLLNRASINIDGMSIPQIKEAIERHSENSIYSDLVDKVKKAWSTIDFDKEAIELKKFLSELV